MSETRDPRSDLKFDQLPQLVIAVVNGEQGTGRDQTHIALEYVDQLRQFVHFEFAQKFPDFCQVRVVGADHAGSFVEYNILADHGSEFIAVKFFSVLTRAALFQDNFSLALAFYGDRCSRKQRRQKDQPDQCQKKIRNIFEFYVCSVHSETAFLLFFPQVKFARKFSFNVSLCQIMAKYAVSERKENGRGRISSSAPDKILRTSYKLLQKLYPLFKVFDKSC